jgi:hypothetical protein
MGGIAYRPSVKPDGRWPQKPFSSARIQIHMQSHWKEANQRQFVSDFDGAGVSGNVSTGFGLDESLIRATVLRFWRKADLSHKSISRRTSRAVVFCIQII